MNDWTFRLYIVLQMIANVLLLAFIVYWPGTWNEQRVVGSILLVTGSSLLLLARFQLGRSFSITPQARKLVMHGLYSRIRNPIYVFGATAGLFLIIHRPVLWVLFTAIVVMQVVRARREAAVLEAKFGDAYRAYRSHTWF
jgi:protein-S-isoprenylcysteine O-methyltransferase Ste14